MVFMYEVVLLLLPRILSVLPDSVVVRLII